MSQATLDQDRSSEVTVSGRQPPRGPGFGQSRTLIVLVLIVALVVSALAREGAQRVRLSATPQGQAAGAASGGQGITGMNSFALALLLGGLRGPLVMMLWTSSESQKHERQLEDFDTKVEWIRLLQPEFDSVHLFQIWNKAYNISVQVASLSNKYSTILDAIDYGRDVDAQRPNNVNILHEIGRIYFDKLGNSAEKVYFSRRLREESLLRPGQRVAARTDPGWRRIEHDPMLTPEGYILPELLEPNPRLAIGTPGSPDGYSDGSELQYLALYQPFPQGLSPHAVGYNYFKRAQVIQSAGNQRHVQIGPMAIDSRPAVAMMFWADDEVSRGRRGELRAFGLPVLTFPRDVSPLDEAVIHVAANPVTLDDSPADVEALMAAIYNYDIAARVAADAEPEYENHIRRYDINRVNHLRHMNHVRIVSAVAAADRDYLRAFTVSGTDRENLLAAARTGYGETINQGTQMILRFYLDDQVVQQIYPAGVTRHNVQDLPPDQRWELVNRAMDFINSRGYDDMYVEDRAKYEAMIGRAIHRLSQLQ